MTTFTIEEPVFKTHTRFIVNCSYQQLQAHMKKEYGKEIEDEHPLHRRGGVQMSFEDYPQRCIWVKQFSLDPTSIAYVVHELFHLVVRLCDQKGIPIIPNIQTGQLGDEAAAYILEFFTFECMKRASRVKRRKPR